MMKSHGGISGKAGSALRLGLSLALIAGVCPSGVSSAPATQPDPPATQPTESIRLNFKDAPLDSVLEQLSAAAGFVIVKIDVPLQTRVTVQSIRPVSPQEAVAILDTVLESNGFAAVQNGRTLRIVPKDKAKKTNVPVHFGDDPAEITSNDKLITQVIPLRNVDAVKLAVDLRPLIGDADLTSNANSNTLIITDTSANVLRVVQIVSTLDHREGAASDIKIVALKNASADSAARLVLAIFKAPEVPHNPNQPAPPPQAPQKIGSGVDQALYGGRVTAAADDRTNSVIIAGPEETVKLVVSMLHDLDTNPATEVTIKSYHLKTADATGVARVISSIFEAGGQPGQARGLGEQSIHARVTAVPEDRANTVIVTAPASVIPLIDTIVKELETSPTADSNIQSFHLKFADATATATILMSVFREGRPGEVPKRLGGVPEQIYVTPDDRSNTIIVTGTAEALKTAARLVQELDVNPADAANVRYFHLKQADATIAAKLITNLFDPRLQPQPSQPTRRTAINAQADDRSNTVIVSAPPESMRVVENLIKEIETNPLTQYEIKTYTLTSADADATSRLLIGIFTPDPAIPTGQPLKAKIIASADDRTNTIVVTAPPETLKVIDALIKLLDTRPGRGTDMQVFQLLYADATSAAKLIQSIFPPPQQQGGARTPRAPGQPELPLVTSAADDRTNTLVVTAPADVLRVIEALVRQLDSNPASQETFFIYRLRHGTALDMALVLNQMFGNSLAAGAQGGGSAAQQAAQNAQRGNRRSLGSPIGTAGSTLGRARRIIPAVTPASAQGGAGALGAPTVASELTGQVLVVADPDTNSLLVTTATKYEKHVRDIIAELDHPVPQVLIKVLVAEVTHDNSADFGTDFSILNQRGTSGFGQNFSQGFGAPGSGLVISFVESRLNATLHALAQQNKLDVLSRPYILASDNQQATVLVGQQVPIVTSNYTTPLGQIVSNYQYQSVGIILDVTPHINPDGLVTLDVSPEISQLTSQTVSVGPGVNAPVIADRSAQSRVAIRDGQTIVIGGLMQDQKTLTINKIPILGDIPLIKYAFSRTQVDKTKTELLIFLTPHVAQSPDVLKAMSQDEQKGMKLTPNAVEPGAFQEHLRGMQRGAVPQTRPASQPSVPVFEVRPSSDGPEPHAPASTPPLRLPPR